MRNNKHVALLVMLTCLLLSACKPGDYAVLVNHDKPEEVARAEVLKAQAEQIRAQTETDRQRALIQTEVIATTAKLNQTLAAERGRAEIQANIEQSKAQTQVTQAIGVSLSSVVYGIGAGLIIAEVVAAVCFTAYVLIALLVRLKQAPARSRAVVVTGYVNNTRMDMIIFQDNDDSWHIIDPLEGSRGAINQSRGAQAMRMHLLSDFAQLALPAPAAQRRQQPQQEGILFRAWHFLFNRKPAARKVEIVE
jgi:type IV secretory pathway VirJ component